MIPPAGFGKFSFSRPIEGSEAELTAMFPHRQLCCECGRYVHQTQDMRCDSCNASREEDEMKVGEAFPGAYLKSSDLQGRRVVVTISEVKNEEVSGDTKPIIYFENKERGLVLNKTNANMIAEILGTDEMDEWHGHRIVLHPAKTEFQGRRVDCIRVDAAPKGAPTPAPKPVPAPAPQAFAAGDSDVSF